MHPFALRCPVCHKIAFCMQYEPKEGVRVFTQWLCYSDPTKLMLGPVPTCEHCGAFVPNHWVRPATAGFVPARDFIAHVERMR
jgi:hypothetical protein